MLTLAWTLNRMLPARSAKVENHWVGFRPGRPSIRLESEVIEVPHL